MLILCNADLSPNVQSALIRQLMISRDGYNQFMLIDGYEFNNRVLADPNYPQIIKGANLKVLVFNTLRDYTNRNLFDVVLFIKAGLVTVLTNNIGPGNFTIPLDQLYYSELMHHKNG